MNALDIEKLVRRLGGGSIAECEFDDDDGSKVRLRFELASSSFDAQLVPRLADEKPEAASLKTLLAPRFGHFLHRHPLSGVGHVEVGKAVQVGDIIGFVQAEDFVVPLRSTHVGVVSQILAEDRALVGYGQTLLILEENGI